MNKINKSNAYTGVQIMLKSIGAIGTAFHPAFSVISALAELMGLKNLDEAKDKQFVKMMENTSRQTVEKLGLSDEKRKVIDDIGLRLTSMIVTGQLESLSDDALDCSFLSYKEFNVGLTPKDLNEIIVVYMGVLYNNIAYNPHLCNLIELQSHEYMIELLKKNIQNHRINTKLLMEILSRLTQFKEKVDYSGLLSQSKSRFESWRRNYGKLYALINDTGKYIPMELINESNVNKLNDLCEKFREREICHISIIGDGGMGKTNTCMNLWDIHISKGNYIFHMSLNEYEPKCEEFIFAYIKKEYSNNDVCFEELIQSEKVIFLLDGFNEIQSKYHDKFTKEINRLKKYMNLQIIITSRYSLKSYFSLSQFNEIRIAEIRDEELDRFLKTNRIENPRSIDLYKVIKNPLMLKIYIYNLKSDIQKTKFIQNDFFDSPTTVGELLWNFLEHQIIKQKEQKNEDEAIFSILLIRHLLPYIAYKIESSEQFSFEIGELNKYINEFISYIKDYTGKFDELSIYKSKVECFLKDDNIALTLLEKVQLDLSIIKQVDNNRFSFIHQYFRDVFSAIYIKNQMMLKNKEVMSERILPMHIRQMLCNILQEHKIATKKSILREYLGNARNQFNKKIQLVVHNAIEIIKYAKNNNLCGEDFSNLDLRKSINLCNICNNAIFDNSYINYNTIIQYGHSNFVNSIAYSPDGSYIISCSADNTIKVWSAYTWELVTTLHKHSASVSSVAYSPDGLYIVSGSYDKSIKVWNTLTWELIKDLNNQLESVNSVAYSPDGKYIISGNSDKTIKIWDTSSWDLVIILKAHSECVTSVDYSPDGRYIISGSRDNTIKVWNASTWDEVETLKGHSDMVISVTFSPNGLYIVSGSRDETVKIWDTSSWKLVKTFYLDSEYVEGTGCSPDGKYVIAASSDSAIEVLDSSSWDSVELINGFTVEPLDKSPINCLTYSTDNKYIISGNRNGTIRVWDASTRKLVKLLNGYSTSINCIAYCPHGRYVISSGWDKTIKVWDISTQKLVKILEGHLSSVKSIAYSSDGKYMISGGWDKTIKVWNTSSWELIKTLEGDPYCVTTLTCSPDGKYMISGGLHGSIKVWDPSTWRLTKTLKGHSDRLASIRYSPDSNYIISGGGNGKIKVWDTSTWDVIKILEGHSREVTCLEYSPDGKHIISGSFDKTIKVWNTSSWDLVETLEGHSKCIQSVSYSRDSSYIISSSYDKTIKVWNTTTWRQVKNFEVPYGHVEIVSYSFNGSNYVLGGMDGMIKVWDTSTWDEVISINILSNINIINSTFINIKSDEITEEYMNILNQNGAVINNV